MLSLSDQTMDSLADALEREGHKRSNAARILRGFWQSDAALDLNAIPIAKAARQFLDRDFVLTQSTVLLRRPSADGTLKLLVGFQSGGAVECVLMPSHRPDRAAACVSSQIGCAMGCDFCASTKGGLVRNLSVGEIVEQFMHLRSEARKSNRRIASLVFMGMGEPMHNLENVICAIKLLAEPGLGSMGYRAITVSTVGIVPGIDQLADANVGVHLALSLHAPDDETRSRLVPSNRRWPVPEIIAAAKRYQERVKRPSNIEYCMLAGVNDSDQQAELLAQLMQGFRAHVNLIPYNSIGRGLSGLTYHRPNEQRVESFAAVLKNRGVVVHIRQTRGDDVSAACGQLRQLSLPRYVTLSAALVPSPGTPGEG